MDNPLTAIPALRTWRRRFTVAAVGLAAALAAVTATRRHDREARVIEACRVAADAYRLDAGDRCLVAYAWTGDREVAVRLARAFASVEGALPLVEALASAIGDRAELWNAVGEARRTADDAQGALISYQQALELRGDADDGGRINDRTGRMLAYQELGDDQHATLEAARAYALVPRVSARDRSVVLQRVASLMLELGNVDTAKQLLDQATPFTPPGARGFAGLAQRLGEVEQALGHPALARRYFVTARGAARGRADMTWAVYTDLLDLAIDQGNVAEASDLIAHAPQVPGVGNDRATAALYRAQLEILAGRYRDAVRTTTQALGDAPEAWIAQLEALRGRALLRDHQLVEAERALRRATDRMERARAALDHDLLKSWLWAKQRAPFEDLFELYVDQDRVRDALEVVQRATARALLDGLIARPRGATIPDGIASAGIRADALRTLTGSSRISPAAPVPAIATVLDRVRGNHIVTYFRAGAQLWAIAIRRDGALRAQRLGEVAELERAVDAWSAHLERDEPAEQLGQKLLPDALAPDDGAPLYVITDAPIREVTFAALRRHGAFVVEHHAVAYALSVATLSVPPRATGRGPAVVIGDPQGNLPGAYAEAIDVARALGVAPVLRAAATRAALARAAHARVLHLAGHTDGSQIELADGTFDAAAVLELPGAPALVTLLGCSSARGKDELGPLAVAFLAAGAHTVVAALWAAHDRRAREVASRLYDGQATDAIEAIAGVQRQMIRDRVAVELWSTFVVFGGLRPRPRGAT